MYLGKNSYDSNSVFLEHLVKCNLKKIKPEYNYLQIHFFSTYIQLNTVQRQEMYCSNLFGLKLMPATCF